MSSIQRRKFKTVTTYQVQVRQLGFKSLSKSFATLTEAKKWCRTMEIIESGLTADFFIKRDM